MRTKAEIQAQIADLKETRKLMESGSPVWNDSLEHIQTGIEWLEWVLGVEE